VLNFHANAGKLKPQRPPKFIDPFLAPFAFFLICFACPPEAGVKQQGFIISLP
jgi:hypothetical protein